MMLADAISVSLILAFAVPIVAFIRGRDIWWLWLLGGLLVINFSVEAVKPLFSTNPPFCRPAGAKACDIFCMGGSVGGAPGFPSGHMTNTTLFAASLCYRYPSFVWIGVPWIGAMGWSRWVKECHNLTQIVGGLFTGLGAAALLCTVAPR
jgi:membrane-associated phospholipid phosphatase